MINAPATDNYHGTQGRDELEITQNRVVFKIQLKDSKEPNTSEVSIYGLNKDSRAIIQKKGNKVVLEAGYADSGTSRIFVGDVRIGDNKKQKADWISVLKLGDGERAWRNARVNKSFAGGTSAGDVLRYLGEASGLQEGNINKKAAEITDRTYGHGYSLSGKWADEMTKFCNSFRLRYSIQNQALQVLAEGEAINEGEGQNIPELSAETGLIDTPEFGTPEKKGKPFLLKFKSLIQPTQVNTLVRINSHVHKGVVLVKKATFSGDTHGGDWYTEYEGVLRE